MSGFVFLQYEFRKSLVNKFEQIVADRRALLFSTLRHDVETAVALANWDSAGLEAALAAGTVSAVQFKDDAGRVVRFLGRPSSSPSIRVTLEAQQQVELLWDGVLTDRVTLPNTHDGRRHGTVVIEQSAASLEKALVDGKQLGARGEIALCVPQQATLACFRGTRHATPFAITAPIGEVTLDSDGRNVMAHREALAPGIIIVVEEGAAEAFGVVRRALTFGAPLLLLISALGGTLLLFQLRPLTRRMVASEALARKQELQMRSILESVITERNERERKLTALSQYDSLTAVPNRSLFLERLSAAALRLEQNGAAFALMFIDVDGFKDVNDRWGHRAGDDLLIQIAGRLCGAVRNSDTVARLAGDEFTVIVETLTSPRGDSHHVADKIVSTMQRPFVLSGREVTISVSLGLVVQEMAGFTTADLLARADRAMYRAKRAGKNRVIAA